MATGYLLDANHLGAARPGSRIRKRILELPKKGTRIGTCMPVVCEVEAGIQRVKDPERYRRALKQLLRRVRIWPIDLETAQIYEPCCAPLGLLVHGIATCARASVTPMRH